MKNFEEWDKQEYPLPPTIERGPVNREMLKQRKHAWRAALKWVHGELINCSDFSDIYWVIVKEHNN